MAGMHRALSAKLLLLLAVTSDLCLGQLPPPSDAYNYAAKVLTMQGQVSLLKDNVLWGLSDGDKVAVQQIIITGPDGRATFQVTDGSTFEVFPNSHVVFRKNAWNLKDLIDVLVGRVRIHIEHLGGAPNPNRILTPTAVISVRGTTLDVSVDDDETTLIEVEEGLVEVRHALLPSAAKMVSAGESIKVYKYDPLASNRFDKSNVFRFVYRMILDAANTMSMRRTVGGLGGNGGAVGGGLGDTGKKLPPPPHPPPPPQH